jgi:LacI family transcriptional regulator
VARRAVTLAEVARRAGVHVSTVSRALSPDAPGIGPVTVNRIRLLAAEMGYQPDPAAAALRTGRSGVLGVLVAHLTDYVLARIYEGVDDTAHDSCYNTVVSSTNDDPELRKERLEELLSRRVEGIVLGDARLDGDELVETLRRRGIPYVLVNRRLRGHPSVTTDDILGGALAADHLLKLGHKQVGIVAGLSYASTCVERTHGFVQRYLAAGTGIPDSLITTSGTDTLGGYEAGSELLRRNPDLTAIFAINDFAAVGVMGAIREQGKVPGRDIAVVGYNDIPLAGHLPVPLTSVSSPMFEMGQQGMSMLIDLIAGKTVRPKRLTPKLMVRGSTTGEPADYAMFTP